MGVLGWIGDKSAEKPLDLCKQFTGRDLIAEFSIHPIGKMIGALPLPFSASSALWPRQRSFQRYPFFRPAHVEISFTTSSEFHALAISGLSRCKRAPTSRT